MKVFEISISVFLIKDIDSKDSFEKIAQFIDSGLAKKTELLELHNSNTYKNYCFCSFYPIQQDRVYKCGNIYTIRIRTIDHKLAKFFNEELVNHYNQDIKALTSTIRILPRKYIDKIYSITPLILKTNGGYWKNNISLSEFERRLKENMAKKYNLFMNTKIDEDFQLYTSIEFKNKKPVAINYKGKTILGDKLTIHISDDRMAQELAYMSLGTGALEMNARGAGYMNAKWL
ncbi:CRISPR-associated endoribonuclease Cas6 [Clostridium tetanomorphum]|uniref:CRISPR-associated endoribonuclease Cas6 n=1 Tax=Clostridium tetanomorphum TaxID=1553 RepID=A0A923EBQ2_CLOTT|nr:CRISPR-associated endoribonuclease Cas6 [Clostridium tetanomorphum]MBC2398824.1 CRISPR-associated endoribonuclease Cas6 [Clostridium tetanomorphum]NRZ96808.1 CRISPR-associated endoribonuclease Cas6 [Clostridium tetanomorphum]